MIWYLAAGYSRRDEMMEFADTLRQYGHEVKCRWITGSHQGMSDEDAAIEDFEDLIKCDGLIAFSAMGKGKRNKGGRHVEFGMAVALNKPTVLIGDRENVFHYLPVVDQFDTVEDFLDYLSEREDEDGE